MTAMTQPACGAPRELSHFVAMDREEQQNAIRRMAVEGWTDHGIAHATRLSVEQIRRTLADRAAP
jgi:hypothetical protein